MISNAVRFLVRITFQAIKFICLALAITSLADILLQDFKFSDELRHRNSVQFTFWVSMFAQIGVLNFGSFIPSLRNILHQVFCLSRSFIQYVFLAASAAACSARGAGWGGKTTRSRSTSTNRRKHMKRDFTTRPCKQILYWLVAFLLLLAFFSVRPPKIANSNHQQLGGVFSIANSAERTQKVEHLDLCEKMSLLGAAGFLSKIICSSLVVSLAGWIHPLLGLCHPRCLRYTIAIKESKRERDLRLQHSADIFTRKTSFRLRENEPRVKVFSYLNMKSSVNHRSKRVVRRLVCADWNEFYSSESPQHSVEIRRLCSNCFNETSFAALVFVVFCCAASFAAALSLAFCILQVVAFSRFLLIKMLLRPRPGQWLTDHILTTLHCCAASCTAVFAKATCPLVSACTFDSSLAKQVYRVNCASARMHDFSLAKDVVAPARIESTRSKTNC